MPRFIYKAKVSPKELKEGVVEADTERAAIYKISQMGYFPVEVAEESFFRPASKNRVNNPFFYASRKISWRDLALFTRQLADLLSSGLTIVKALEVISRQTDNRRLRIVINDMCSFVKDGGAFCESLARHPDIFSKIYVSMNKAGETGGMLEETLNRLADYAEREEQLRYKIQTALAYPILITILGVLTITVLLTFVIPRLVTIFEDTGQVLPLPTLILIRVSNFLVHYGWFFLVIAAIFIFLIGRRAKTKEGKIMIDDLKMKIFGVGPLIKKTEIARFTRTLGTLLTNGVVMMQALEVSSWVVENEVVRQDVRRILQDVSAGVSFSKAAAFAKTFPLFVTNMLSVADESGHFEKTLLKIAEACERDVDRTTRLLTNLLEPFIILVMGGVVGFIVISMLLPIFQINLMAR